METQFEKPPIEKVPEPEIKKPHEWKWLTNIGAEEQKQQRLFYESQGKEVRFSPAQTKNGDPITGMVALEVRDKIYGEIPYEAKLFLEKLQTIDSHSEIGIERFDDSEATFYRGTILGLVISALAKERGDLRSFSPDREGFKPMETTVISDHRSVAENYAKLHGPDKPTTEHDIRGIASALNLDPGIIKEQYPSLLLPVVLHFKKTIASENPEWPHEFQTPIPLNLLKDLTETSRKQLEEILAMNLEDINLLRYLTAASSQRLEGIFGKSLEIIKSIFKYLPSGSAKQRNK